MLHLENDPTRQPVTGLLLAAGGGARLGGRPKALLPYRGAPLVEHALSALWRGGCAQVCVVLGAAAATVCSRAHLGEAQVVENPDWPLGMGGSLRTGLSALRASSTEGALVCLVDQPRIGPEVISRVLGSFAGRTTLAAATYAERRGHPVLFGAAHFAAVLDSAQGDRGARDYLRQHEVTPIECGDLGDPADIDTQDDLTLLDN